MKSEVLLIILLGFVIYVSCSKYGRFSQRSTLEDAFRLFTTTGDLFKRRITPSVFARKMLGMVDNIGNRILTFHQLGETIAKLSGKDQNVDELKEFVELGIEKIHSHIDVIIDKVFSLPNYVEDALTFRKFKKHFRDLYTVREIIDALYETRNEVLKEEAREMCIKYPPSTFLSYLLLAVVNTEPFGGKLLEAIHRPRKRAALLNMSARIFAAYNEAFFLQSACFEIQYEMFEEEQREQLRNTTITQWLQHYEKIAKSLSEIDQKYADKNNVAEWAKSDIEPIMESYEDRTLEDVAAMVVEMLMKEYFWIPWFVLVLPKNHDNNLLYYEEVKPFLHLQAHKRDLLAFECNDVPNSHEFNRWETDVKQKIRFDKDYTKSAGIGDRNDRFTHVHKVFKDVDSEMNVIVIDDDLLKFGWNRDPNADWGVTMLYYRSESDTTFRLFQTLTDCAYQPDDNSKECLPVDIILTKLSSSKAENDEN